MLSRVTKTRESRCLSGWKQFIESGFASIEGKSTSMSNITLQPSIEGFEPDEQVANPALAEFVDWCEKYRLFIEQGRKYGFRLAVSAGVKDAIALQLPKDMADRINASLLDVQ